MALPHFGCSKRAALRIEKSMETSLNSLLTALLPDLPPLQFDGCTQEENSLTLWFQTTASPIACPQCGLLSSRVRSRYRRTIWDLPWADRGVRICVHLRKFACINLDCPRRIFAERLPHVAPYARSTPRRIACQTSIGLALGGEAGTRLSRDVSLCTSPATLLRRIRRMPEPTGAKPRVVGVDDWALRKGTRYGTLLVDQETRRPLELLPERTSELLIAWLKQQPQIEVITRDRSTEFARAATEGAPQAVQVADRFHLLANLRDALQHLVERERSTLSGITLPNSVASTEAEVAAVGTRLPEKRSPAEEAKRQQCQALRKERHLQVQQRRAKGDPILRIAQDLNLSRTTVSRYLRLDEASATVRSHPSRSILDVHLPHLVARWEEGCHNATQLWREIVARGYPGTPAMVYVWAQHQRTEPSPNTPTRFRESLLPPAEPRKRLPTPRAVAFFLVRRVNQLSSVEQQVLAQIQKASPLIAAGYALFHQFRGLFTSQVADKLPVWIQAARMSGLPDMENFASGLERDLAAIENAVSLPWSNGLTEGHVNRLKMLKRQMYGRANFDLLRRRVLYA